MHRECTQINRVGIHRTALLLCFAFKREHGDVDYNFTKFTGLNTLPDGPNCAGVPEDPDIYSFTERGGEKIMLVPVSRILAC